MRDCHQKMSNQWTTSARHCRTAPEVRQRYGDTTENFGRLRRLQNPPLVSVAANVQWDRVTVPVLVRPRSGNIVLTKDARLVNHYIRWCPHNVVEPLGLFYNAWQTLSTGSTSFGDSPSWKTLTSSAVRTPSALTTACAAKATSASPSATASSNAACSPAAPARGASPSARAPPCSAHDCPTTKPLPSSN